jgi:two-component system LytT family sensor kinase
MRIIHIKIFLLIIFFSKSNFLFSQSKNPDIDSLMLVLKNQGADSNQVKTLNTIGWVFSGIGQYDSAIRYSLKAISLAQKTVYKKEEAKGFGLLGQVYSSQGNYIEAVNQHKMALKIREEINDKDGIGHSYQNIGVIYKMTGNYPEALKSYLNALKAYELSANKGFMTGAYFTISSLYEDIGDYEVPLKYSFLILQVHRELKNTQGAFGSMALIASYQRLAVLYEKLYNYPEALKNYLAALEINVQETASHQTNVRLYLSIGDIYFKQTVRSENEKKDKLNAALKNYFIALNICEEINDRFQKIDCLQRIAQIYKSFKNYREALKNYLTALNISEEIKNIYKMAECYLAIGTLIYEEFEKSKTIEKNIGFRDAVSFLTKGLVLAKENNEKKLIQDFSKYLSKISNELKKYKEALEYTNLYMEVSDSLNKSMYSEKIYVLRTEYEVQKAIKNEHVEQDKEKAEIQFAFSKRVDSINYQQSLTSLQLAKQILLTKQRDQNLLLTQNSLHLINKENELNRLSLLNFEAELQKEQSERKDKEQQLLISEKEKDLQNNQLRLQKAQLNLKENQLRTHRKQRLFYFGGIVLVTLLFVFIYRNIKNGQNAERLIATERLNAEKANAAHAMAELELQSLRAQLNPHFMFNSLNAIQELILKEDNDNSHLYLSRFSELLRLLLDNANQPFLPIRKEINLLELYLSLENLRIPDLKYSIEIDPSIDSNKKTIPNMMLQPYIENAIWHGLSHKKGDRNLKIKVSRQYDNNDIVCEIEDNGVGRKLSGELKSLYRKEHRSKGMELLSKRFSLLSKEYGSNIQTRIEDLYDNDTARGTRVTILVPLLLTEQIPIYS